VDALAAQASVDRRREPRLQVGNQVVLIDLCNGRGEVTCCMWDISTRGACLMIPPDVSMPHTFKIILDNCRYTARVVWRRWSYVGVEFVKQGSEDATTSILPELRTG
jgi:hypothetical protein